MATRTTTQAGRKGRTRTVPSRRAKARPPQRTLNGSGDTKPIAAVERALSVLNAFRSAPKLTLSELSKRTGLFKSTLLRILGTLEQNGYVMRLGDHYQLGGILFELGAGYVASFQLDQVMKPALARLATTTGESASFYMRTGARRQCMFRVESPQSVRDVILPGQIMDIDATACGLIFRRHETPTRRPTAAVDYASLCKATASVGDPLTASVAAPIYDTNGFLGVMVVSGPVTRFTETTVPRIRSELANTAASISSALGGIATEAAARSL